MRTDFFTLMVRMHKSFNYNCLATYQIIHQCMLPIKRMDTIIEINWGNHDEIYFLSYALKILVYLN